jgi:hypothetical protein
MTVYEKSGTGHLGGRQIEKTGTGALGNYGVVVGGNPLHKSGAGIRGLVGSGAKAMIWSETNEGSYAPLVFLDDETVRPASITLVGSGTREPGSPPFNKTGGGLLSLSGSGAIEKLSFHKTGTGFLGLSGGAKIGSGGAGAVEVTQVDQLGRKRSLRAIGRRRRPRGKW